MNHPNAPLRAPILGCIADDVTGATDLAINLVQGGMRVVQMFGAPDAASLAEITSADAIVVALKTRSIPAKEAVSQTIDSLHALQELGITRFYFKYCSTFDSTNEGNIGPVASALVEELKANQTIFCPAFPRAGRTVYRGHLFVDDRLLNESGMQSHPLNPMTDSNLIRLLGSQISQPVGLLRYSPEGDVATTRSRLAAMADQGVSMVVTDTCTDSDLPLIAEAVWDMPLVTGGSGLGRYLPDAYREHGLLRSPPYQPVMPTIPGRNLILAGSCSTATNAQVAWMSNRCAAWKIDVDRVMQSPESERQAIEQWAHEHIDDGTWMISSTAKPDQITNLQAQYGGHELAQRLEDFTASLANNFVASMGVRRLVIAGGETSGAVVERLNIRSLDIGPEICPGVPWTCAKGDASLALALKSGNFGPEDFFSVALEMLS